MQLLLREQKKNLLLKKIYITRISQQLFYAPFLPLRKRKKERKKIQIPKRIVERDRLKHKRGGSVSFFFLSFFNPCTSPTRCPAETDNLNLVHFEFASYLPIEGDEKGV